MLWKLPLPQTVSICSWHKNQNWVSPTKTLNVVLRPFTNLELLLSVRFHYTTLTTTLVYISFLFCWERHNDDQHLLRSHLRYCPVFPWNEIQELANHVIQQVLECLLTWRSAINTRPFWIVKVNGLVCQLWARVASLREQYPFSTTFVSNTRIGNIMGEELDIANCVTTITNKPD